MKKYILSWILTISACFVFADSKEELKNIVTNIDTKEFADANKNIDKLHKQGEQYVSQGKYEKALESYKKALAQSDKLFGKNSTAAASSYVAMAVPYIKMGKGIKAAETLVKAAEIFKKSAGGIFRPRAGRLLLLRAGFLYFDSQYYRMAYRTLEQAKKDIKFFSVEEKKKYLPKFNEYLGIAYMREGEYKKAIPCLQKSIDYENKELFPSKEKLSQYHLFLGEAMLETNNIRNVLGNLEESRRLSSYMVGNGYEFYLLQCFARTYKYLNSNEKYLSFAKDAIRISDKFADNDIRKTIGKIIFADAKYKSGDIVEAKKLLKDAIIFATKNSIYSKIINRMRNLQKLWCAESKNTDKAKIRYWRGRVCLDEHRLDDAYQNLEKALTYEKQKKPLNYKRLSKIYYWLGKSNIKFGQWKQSINSLEKSWAYTKKYKADTDFLIMISGELSCSYNMLKDFKRALKYGFIAYNKHKYLYGNNNFRTGMYASAIGVRYANLNQKKNAIKYLKIAYNIFLKHKKQNPYPADTVLNHLRKLQDGSN